MQMSLLWDTRHKCVKMQSNIVADSILFFFFFHYFLEKIRLYFHSDENVQKHHKGHFLIMWAILCQNM